MKITMFLFLSLLFVSTCGQISIAEGGDSELTNYLDSDVTASASEAAVRRAAEWLLDQRQADDYSWGSFTSRAAVALALADEVSPRPQGEKDLIAKQVNILLSLELGNGLKSGRIGLSRLALYINALYATCQNPRSFHGLDLINRLRTETDAEIHKAGDSFGLPAVFLPLCFSNETTHNDLRKLFVMYSGSGNKTDLQALELLAMSCITSQSPFASYRASFINYLRDFTARFHSRSMRNLDVYTKALALQAMNTGRGADELDMSWILSEQESDGSFERSLLATYQAIPAMLGKSLLAIKDIRCGGPELLGRLSDSPLSQSGASRKVYLSVWIGEGVKRDSHTVTVTTANDTTLLNVMRVAQDRNPIFRFNYDETSAGKRVYSLAGIPNDVEREIYWALYLTRDGRADSPRATRVSVGVDRIIPSSEDHLVFWFKRSSY